MAADRTVVYRFRGSGEHLSREMAKLGVQMEALDDRLDSVDKGSLRVRRSTRAAADGGIAPLGSAARRSAADIDSFSGRLGLLATAATTLGPALVPLSTVAVPAVAGLASGLGALAGAAGVTMLAFNGVGDSLSALNAYQLEPTAENLAKMQQEFDKLGASGVEFVRYLDSLGPELERLQRIAGDNMFPGMQAGLEEATELLPDVRDLVADLSSTMGDLARDAGASLANDSDWQAFFDYLSTDAAPTLDAFGRSIGNFVAGFANMMTAFAPLSRDFASAMMDWSESFREWSAGLGENQGFQEFIDYIREQGPAVGEFFASLGSAVVDLAKAVAPWGEAVLPVLTSVLDVFSAIAGSDIGPALFTAGAAMLAFNKTMGLVAATMTRFGAGGAAGVAGTGGVFGVMGQGAEKARGSIAGFGRDIRKMSGEYRNLGRASSTALSAFSGTTAAAQRTRETLRGVGGAAGRAAVPVAALGSLSTGLADSLGATNTATLTLAGSMAGPWGAAAGAAAGAALDIAGANDEAAASVERLNEAISSGSLTNATSALSDMRSEVEAFRDDMSLTAGEGFLGALSPITAAGEAKNFVEGLFGESDVEELEAAAAQAERRLTSLQGSAADLAETMGANLTGDAEKDMVALEQALADAQPAMRELGITTEDLANEGSFTMRLFRESVEAVGVEVPSLVDRIASKMSDMDSQSSRVRSVADAISDVGTEALTSAKSADQLAAALQGLMQPGQSLVAAQDQWTQGLRNLGDELVRVPDLVNGTSDAAIANRAAISDQVTALQELLTAQANSGASGDKLTKTLKQGRQSLIAAGEAAGISRKEMGRLLDKFGLTPDLIETTVKLNDKASGPIAQVGQKLGKLGGQVAWPRADLRDRASGPIAQVGERLGRLGHQSARPSVSVNDNASNVLGTIGARIASLPSHKTITVTTVGRTIGNIAGGFFAEGGMTANNVRTYADGGLDRAGMHEPQIAAPSRDTVRVWAEPETQGESYIPHANDHRRPRAKDILEQTAAMFGGRVAWFADGGSMSPRQVQTSRPAPVGSIGAGSASVRRVGRPWDGRLTLMVDGEAIGGVIAEIASGQVEASELMAAEHARAL